MSADYSVVIPTTGRDNLRRLLETLDTASGPRPREIIVVDDRPDGEDLTLPDTEPPVRVVRSGGRGPAAARNAGWRHATGAWIAFLDDDVVIAADWPARLADDLRDIDETTAASTARIEVALPAHRKPTDEERGVARLADARWITADMAYRRTVLAEVGGFDERFPRAFREDADLAIRVCLAGYRIADGRRRTSHPVRQTGALASVRAQRGNADNALMRRKYGAQWRQRIGEAAGLLPRHTLTTAAGAAALALGVTRHRRAALACATVWTALTADFAARRIAPGPRTPVEVGQMILSSALIPPAACWHRLRGELRHRHATHASPLALLFDRDDTLIVDVPYNADPAKVRPVPGAADALRAVRAAGLRLGVVSNQSGVARGLISHAQLAAVNSRVEELLGPFETWQVCVHGEDDGCACRKPAPGMVQRAAAQLGVDVRRCVLIGDTGADIAAATSAGARAILVPTARTRPEEVERARREAAVAPDLTEAVRLAMAGGR
ncbi:HAD superfamily hydrolase (TIGR01509 family)/HAD superfamily hydrolase (TIGR01549 family) [Nocardia tenerifensis]|uniref:D,D-heptose 1,7-bisphosphate phosphatase n=2 Tax=Nocardia tenerifensis TaxID=228006 RepID=A0A318KCS4_9NOCA|nr:HAD-IIIA family hydrolase [Nocardia tenerifensis]PXX68920.1 HAD superfamily hydrolase (TIGR01509 family)/HAD superfamily hydrolase (TIGR01549 family) [Nocardia tenerifensis]